MKTKNIILAALPLLSFFAACDNDIYEPIEFNVSLSADNTFVAGEPVNFDISGNANYVLLYTGELGAEYQYADRTVVDTDQIESCRLYLEVKPLWGTTGDAGRGALQVYIIPDFEGLVGNDQDTDYTTLKYVEQSDYEGWIDLEIDDSYTSSTADFSYYDFDIMDYLDSFTIAFHWNPQSYEVVQRTFYINVSLEVKFKDYEASTIECSSLGFTTVSMADAFADNRYAVEGGNGYVNFTKTAGDLTMSGVAANVLDYCIDTYVISAPRALNSISPDSALDLKGMPDDLDSYTYTYAEPGEYTATFIGTSANIYGSSRKVQNITFTIADNGYAEGDTSLGGLTEGEVEASQAD